MLFQKIQHYIIRHNLIASGNKIVIGFSGGPDSMLLLHFLNSIKHTFNITLIAAHLDHGWRENSASEVLFCESVCAKLEIPFVSARLQELALEKQTKGSKEEVGRNARRFFLETIACEHNANLIALGQHLDDQEETFFIRLIRGSTLSGLTCIKPKEGVYIRPLLEIKKQEILDYLDREGIAYLTDPSNELDIYLRNRIRKYVIPALRETDDRFDHNFLRTLDSIQSAEQYLITLTKRAFGESAHQANDTWHLDITKLRALDSFLQYRVLLLWLIKSGVPFVPTERFLAEVMRFIEQPGSKTHTLHTHWSMVKKKNIVFIEKH